MANLSLCFSIAFTIGSIFQMAGATEINKADSLVDQGVSCLAANIYHEARGESLLGQRAVADVTLNRVDLPQWPNTLCEVVWQPYQFSWTHDDISDDMIDGPAKELAYRIAWESLNTPRDNDATHYHATYTLPYWAASLEYTQTIGLHKFYK